MNIKTKISICLILLFVIICTFLPNKIYATNDLSNIMNQAEDFLDKSSDLAIDPTGNLKDTSNFIYNILFTIAVVVAFAVGMIIGIQFITGSVDEKAKIKETLVPYVVGVFVIFGAFTIWKVITEFGTKLTESTVEEIQQNQQIEEEKRQMEAIKAAKQQEMDSIGKGDYFYCKTCNARYKKALYLDNKYITKLWNCKNCQGELTNNISNTSKKPAERYICGDKDCYSPDTETQPALTTQYNDSTQYNGTKLNIQYTYCNTCKKFSRVGIGVGPLCPICGSTSDKNNVCTNNTCYVYTSSQKNSAQYLRDGNCPADGNSLKNNVCSMSNYECKLANISWDGYTFYYKHFDEFNNNWATTYKMAIKKGDFAGACPSCSRLIQNAIEKNESIKCPYCQKEITYLIVYEDLYD